MDGQRRWIDAKNGRIPRACDAILVHELVIPAFARWKSHVLTPLYSRAIISICGLAGSVSAVLFDDFDGYANQAAFQTVWPSWTTDGSR